MVIVVMGVSGSGKTTVGRLLAARLALPFQEGDDLHPAGNIAKMHAGVALDDEDRAPWLDRVAGWIAAHASGGGVVSCSALKRTYRDRLRVTDAPVCLVYLKVDPAVLQRRLATRTGHFMPPTLLASQLDTLEVPDGEPDVIEATGGNAAETVEAVLARVAPLRNGYPDAGLKRDEDRNV